MRFSEKLRQIMVEKGLSQADISNLTGIGKSSISQYISGRNEPVKARQRAMATALGLSETYFDEFLPASEVTKNIAVNLPIPLAAALLGKSREWVKKGLQDGVFPWGYAVKMKNWSYFISSIKFEEFTGIEIPKR